MGLFQIWESSGLLSGIKGGIRLFLIGAQISLRFALVALLSLTALTISFLLPPFPKRERERGSLCISESNPLSTHENHFFVHTENARMGNPHEFAPLGLGG